MRRTRKTDRKDDPERLTERGNQDERNDEKKIAETEHHPRLRPVYHDLGRPYKHIKTIDELIAEFQSRAGTQYGPEAAAVLSVPRVRDRLQYLITEGRREIYYRIYAFNKL